MARPSKFEVLYWIICAGQIWGQTRCSMFGRTAEQIEGQTRYLARAAGFLTRAARYGDRHDVRYADQERSTSNVQLSTFNGVTGRAHGGLDMGTDTVFCRSAVQIEGQTQHLARGGPDF